MQKPSRGRPRKLLPVDSRLPKTAPELWAGVRAGGEALPEFFQRVWSPYLAFGLMAAHIRRLDGPLWKALHQHVVTYELPWPAHLAIPGLRPKKPDIAAKLDQGRWRELSDNDIILALMQRQRDQLKEQLHALRQRKSELRQQRAATRSTLRKPSATK